MNRETFLTRVRQAAHTGRQYRVHRNEPAESNVGYIGGGADPVDHLAAEIIAVGGEAYIVADAGQAIERMRQLLEHYQPRTALCWQHPLLDLLQTGTLLQSLGVERLSYDDLSPRAPAEQQTKMLAADIGITSASYAIAETGSLVMQSRPGQERLASLLPPVHLAIVDSSQILPDLFDLFAILNNRGVDALPSNLVLITGPSKTGDIELKLTTGVHGPGQWHVIIIRQGLLVPGTLPAQSG